MTNTHSRTIQIELDAEEGQTMAEYSVVLTLILIVVGLGAFVLLGDTIADEFDRIRTVLS